MASVRCAVPAVLLLAIAPVARVSCFVFAPSGVAVRPDIFNLSMSAARAPTGGAISGSQQASSACTGASNLRAEMGTAIQSTVSHTAFRLSASLRQSVNFVLSAVTQAATVALLIFLTPTSASAASTAGVDEKPAGLSYVLGTRWFKPDNTKVGYNELKTARVDEKLKADVTSSKVPKKVQICGVMAGDDKFLL